MSDYQAGVIEAPLTFKLHDAPTPQPGTGEVLIRLSGCGVCASNLAIWEGAPWFSYPVEPGMPGHEGWGVIESVGANVSEFQPGDQVAALTYHAYATHDLSPVGSVVRLPESLHGSYFPAEPLACAMNIFERSHIQAGQKVAIIGIGFLGALLVQMAVRAGAGVTAVSRRGYPLQLAREQGAAHVYTYDDAIPREAYDVVIEATGKQSPLDLAADMTAIRGRLVIAGYHQDGPRTVNMQLWNWRGLDVINAHERDPQRYTDGMRAAIQAAIDGKIDVMPLLTHAMPLADLPHAFHLMQTRPGGFMKAVVLM